MRDGKLSFIIRGRKKEELSVPAKLNDGNWHQVKITCIDRKTTLSVQITQGGPPNQATMKLPKKLGASKILFAGGIPENTTLPNELLSKLEEFKGCMRRFIVNGLTQDLARNHKNVGQCFPKVEKGSFFPGDAYAVYSKFLKFFIMM